MEESRWKTNWQERKDNYVSFMARKAKKLNPANNYGKLPFTKKEEDNEDDLIKHIEEMIGGNGGHPTKNSP